MVFPESCFQSETASLGLPRNHIPRLPPPPQTSLPLQFSALVAKYTLQDDTGLDEGDEGDESDTHTSDNGSDSGDNDNQVYT